MRNSIFLSFGVMLLTASCGILSADVPLFDKAKDPQGIADLVSKVGGAAKDQIPKCEALGKADIAFEEERSLGGAAMVAYGSKFGGLSIDLPQEFKTESASSLTARMNNLAKEARRKITLPQTGDNRLHKSIATIGWHLAKLSERDTIPWTFCVINNPSVNAYSSPGGYVCVTEGLLKTVKNEAELACVLAHEIGHVVKKHGPLEYGEIKQKQCLAALGGQLASELVKPNINFGTYFDLNNASKELVQKLVDSFVERIVSAGFGKEAEFEADAYMDELIGVAGYNHESCQAFLRNLPHEGGVFANHPSPEERITKLQELANQNRGSFGYTDQGQIPFWSFETARSKG